MVLIFLWVRIFVLFVLGVVPSLLAHVGFQEYLAKGLLWQVFWMHIPAYIVQVLCCVLLIPTYKGVGYSLSLLCSSLVLCLTLWWVSYWKVEKESPPSTPINSSILYRDLSGAGGGWACWQG